MPNSASGFQLPQDIQSVLDTYCVACHHRDSTESEIRLDSLGKMNEADQLGLLGQIETQLHFRLMPPEEETQLKEEERHALISWVQKELSSKGVAATSEKLSGPEYGNYLDHSMLFSGEYADQKAFTYDRRWLISQFIFEEKFNRLLNHKTYKTIDGQRQQVIGDNNRRVNLTNPFLLPTNTGVRYYANTVLNGGHLLTMIANAKEAATYMVDLARRDHRYLPAVTEIMEQEWQHERLLESRQKFLSDHIEQVLKDIFQSEHEALLPSFVQIDFRPNVSANGEPVKKAAFHAANPGMQELILIFRTMRKHEADSENDTHLIEQCERDWFNFGYDTRQIGARITFLHNYLPEFREQIIRHRYERKYKPQEYRPLDDAEMTLIAKTIRQHRKQGDRFREIIGSCMDAWVNDLRQERIENGGPDDSEVESLVRELFEKILERESDVLELEKHVSLTKSYIDSMGNRKAIEKLIETLLLNSEFVYRQEFGTGKPDAEGRRRMSPRDASYAIAYAITDSSPDEELKQAAESGRLETRTDYRREVERLLRKRDQFYVVDEAVQRLQLTASITNTPIRTLRFFREFFGYPKLLSIFKDNKRFGGNYDNSKGRLVGEADRLVDHILQTDQKVIEKLLSTEDFYVYHSGDNEAMLAASERIRTIYDYFKDLGWRNFEREDLLSHKDFLAKVKMRGVDVNNLASGGRRDPIREFKTAMESFTLRFDKGQTAAAPYVSFPAHGPYNASTRTGLQLRSPEVAKFFNIRLDDWNYPAVQPAKVAHRKGMLSHPAWLIAHAKNTETDPISRGKWIREKLLAGTVPDLPITVDAVIPEDHHRTLRQRLDSKTRTESCWTCHEKMNPLGLPFEIYDDFGRYRKQESLEHPDNLLERGPDKAAVHVDLRDTYRTLPVNSTGHLSGTGDEHLDGPVSDALELIDRLADSSRVRQSVIRHAFRYYMGRNEMLSDSRTLIDAEQAYLDSDGSFQAVIVSLLTSDSFIYRKPIP